MKNIYRNESSIIFKNEFQDFETGHLLSPVETQNFTIIQVADSYYGSHFCIPQHMQYCDLEITLAVSNGLFSANNGKWQKLNKHDVFLTYKNDIHELKSNRGCRFQTLAINIKNNSLLPVFYAIKEVFSNDYKCNLQEISPMFTQIVSEFVSENSPFTENYIDSLITAVLVKLSRSKLPSNTIDVLSTQETLPAIVNYIDSHFLDIYSLEELSAKFGYNYSHICKTFKKCYGITPSDYLLSKKMDYSVKLLKNKKSIKYISECLNYSTPYNFSRAFKKHFGVSPTKFQI